MKLSEKIYISKEKWNCDFEIIAFLLDMDPEEIEQMYLEERKKRFLNGPIKESDDIKRLVLSNRALHALRNAEINTVKEVIENISQLQRTWGFGKKTFDEIQNALKAAGFNI